MNHGQVVISEVPYTMQATTVCVEILANSLPVTSLYSMTPLTRNSMVFPLLGYCRALLASKVPTILDSLSVPCSGSSSPRRMDCLTLENGRDRLSRNVGD